MSLVVRSCCRQVLATSLRRRYHVRKFIRPAIEAPMGLKRRPQIHEVRIIHKIPPHLESNVHYHFSFIDPTLEHDLTSQTKPWALSPLISTMPNFSHTRLTSRSPTPPPFPSPKSIGDDTSQLDVPAKCNGGGSPRSSSKRRAHFSQAKNRKQVVFGPHVRLSSSLPFLLPAHPDTYVGLDNNRLLLRLHLLPRTHTQPPRRYLIRPNEILGRPASPLRLLRAATTWTSSGRGEPVLVCCDRQSR